MAQRDYKPRPARKARKRPADAGPSRWMVFAAGLAVGAGLTVAVVRGDLLERAPAVAASGKDALAGQGRLDGAKPQRLRFEFYSLLPEAEVVVPESELARERASETKRPAPREPDTGGRAPVREATADRIASDGAPADAPASDKRSAAAGVYLLQVGSFRKNDQAEQLRARLALLGLQARIETVTVDGKAKWHRVRLGPFRDVERLDEARTRLGRDGVQSLVLRGSG